MEPTENELVAMYGVPGISDGGQFRAYCEKSEKSQSGGSTSTNGKCYRWLTTLCRKAGGYIGVSGLRYVLRPAGHIFRKLCWLLILGGALAMLTIQVIDRTAYYISKPVSFSIENNSSQKGIVFPKVVVCNLNSYMKSRTQKQPIYDALLKQYQQNIFFPAIESNQSDEDLGEIPDLNSAEVLALVAQQPEDMFIKITFGNEQLSLKDVSTIFTNWGVCYQLNAGVNGSQLLTSQQPGRSWGLNMILDTQQHDYYFGLLDRYSAGFLIQLLDQNEEPLISELGLDVLPGTSNSIALKTIQHINIEPPYGECGKKQLKYNSDYTRTKCQLECYTDFVVEKCGCKSPYLPGDVPICDPLTNTYCAYAALEEVRGGGSLDCDCPAQCESVEYAYSLSSAKFPSPFFADYLTKYFNDNDILQNGSNITSDYLTENLVSVDVFFSDINIACYRQQAAYSFFALLSDIGGSLGLWLGGSLLTLYEIADMCGVTLFSAFRKKRESKMAENSNVQ